MCYLLALFAHSLVYLVWFNDSNIKKYGSASDLRVIQHRVVTRLLFDAKNGKFEN